MGAIKVKFKLDATQFFKKLKLYSDKVMKEAEQEVFDTGLLIESDAKQESFGMPIDTGRLKNSIHVVTQPSESFKYQDDEGKSYDGSLNGTGANKAKLTVAVGSNVEYAEFQNNKHDFIHKATENNRKEFESRIKKILKG